MRYRDNDERHKRDSDNANVSQRQERHVLQSEFAGTLLECRKPKKEEASLPAGTTNCVSYDYAGE